MPDPAASKAKESTHTGSPSNDHHKRTSNPLVVAKRAFDRLHRAILGTADPDPTTSSNPTPTLAKSGNTKVEAWVETAEVSERHVSIDVADAADAADAAKPPQQDQQESSDCILRISSTSAKSATGSAAGLMQSAKIAGGQKEMQKVVFDAALGWGDVGMVSITASLGGAEAGVAIDGVGYELKGSC